MRKFTLIMVAGALALTVFGLGVQRLADNMVEAAGQRAAEEPAYDATTEAGFMAACGESPSPPGFCGCMWDGITNLLTPSEFFAIEAQLQDDPQAAPRSVRVLARTCYREAE